MDAWSDERAIKVIMEHIDRLRDDLKITSEPEKELMIENLRNLERGLALIQGEVANSLRDRENVLRVLHSLFPRVREDQNGDTKTERSWEPLDG